MHNLRTHTFNEGLCRTDRALLSEFSVEKGTHNITERLIEGSNLIIGGRTWNTNERHRPIMLVLARNINVSSLVDMTLLLCVAHCFLWSWVALSRQCGDIVTPVARERLLLLLLLFASTNEKQRRSMRSEWLIDHASDRLFANSTRRRFSDSSIRSSKGPEVLRLSLLIGGQAQHYIISW